MAVWGLVPGVKTVSATYDPRKQLLKLCADGVSNFLVWGIEFVREPWIGSLKFNLMGWIGPPTPIPEHWSHCQSFPVPYDPTSVEIGLDKVLVATSDKPRGELVDVKWTGAGADTFPKPLISDAPKADQTAASVTEPLLIPEPIRLIEALHASFTIKTFVGSQGFSIKYDSRYLVLLGSGVQRGTAHWDFYTNRLGDATIKVTLEGGGCGNQRLWDVDIIVGPDSLDVRSVTAKPDKAAELVPPYVSFLDGVGFAVNLVREKYKDAELYSIDCSSWLLKVAPTSSAYDISSLNVNLRWGEKHRVEIHDIGWWADWTQPVLYEDGIPGVNAITWPPGQHWNIGLEEAVAKLLENKEAPRKFYRCLLKTPTSSALQNPPLYYFLMENFSVWSVNAQSGSVQKQILEEGPVSKVSFANVQKGPGDS